MTRRDDEVDVHVHVERADEAPREAVDRPSRRERLHALLFAGAAAGTTLLTLGAAADPKIPPFKGE
jgi:hypothetical protein